MAKQNLYLVVYDISNDRRRTKLHDFLLDYGRPVQYSVFECLLDQKTQETMSKRIGKIIRPRKDSLRIYFICDTCASKAEVTGGLDVLTPSEEAVIVG